MPEQASGQQIARHKSRNSATNRPVVASAYIRDASCYAAALPGSSAAFPSRVVRARGRRLIAPPRKLSGTRREALLMIKDPVGLPCRAACSHRYRAGADFCRCYAVLTRAAERLSTDAGTSGFGRSSRRRTKAAKPAGRRPAKHAIGSVPACGLA